MIQTGSSGQIFHSSFSLRHLARCLHHHRQEEEMTVLFCFSAFIVSLAVVPALAICSAVFTAAAFVCPMFGVLRLIFNLLSLDVPFVKDCVLSCLSPCAGLAGTCCCPTSTQSISCMRPSAGWLSTGRLQRHMVPYTGQQLRPENLRTQEGPAQALLRSRNETGQNRHLHGQRPKA